MLAPRAALAHERRLVGPYTFVVGWGTEPAYLGEPNGASVRISRTDGGEPVTGAETTLKVSIASGGGQPKEFPLRAVFGQPGLYQADLIPTNVGSYLFTFTGTVGETQVNERFESGPGRFDDIQPLSRLQFPDVVPAPAELAQSLESAEARAAAAQRRAAQAQTFGIAGTVLGGLGLVLGAAGLLSARSARRGGAARPADTGVAEPATAR
ncbi:MAG: hypothetical protein ACRDJN_12100 [Chloroflexota bacterium]